MKTKIEIEIETADDLGIFPESDGIELTKEELKEYQEDYNEKLHKYLIGKVSKFDEDFEDDCIECMETLYVENFDTFDDYGIKITAKVMK